MLLRGLSNNLEQIVGVPLRLARILPDASATLGRTAVDAAGRIIAGTDPRDSLGRVRVPTSAFNRPMEFRRVFQLRRYPLDEIKRMRALAEGATLNDVVLTLIGGGLERYLAAAGEACGQDLVALCPINLREDKFSSASQLGNNISLMQVNLQTRTGDPAERLRKVVKNTTRAKLAQKATAAKELIALSKKTPNLLLAASMRLAVNTAFRDRGIRLSNCIITNVPGPQEPLYFMGARLEIFTGVAPVTPNSGLSIPVTSYRGELCVAPTGCPGWIKDPQLLAECLDESYRELAAAAAEVHAASHTVPRDRSARKAGVSRPAGNARGSGPARKTPGIAAARKTLADPPTRGARGRPAAATRRR
jgi:WS/DGAT/MGAT family acyltransferase